MIERWAVVNASNMVVSTHGSERLAADTVDACNEFATRSAPFRAAHLVEAEPMERRIAELEAQLVAERNNHRQTLDACHEWREQALAAHEDSHEPGELIVESACPCCGAELRVEYGDDEGEIGILGVRT